ncbi:tRNA methyltransferase 10 homolog C [Hemibagrus wyckioides]|uniref:tRNA methyltransferase 10 homolog C n=1 Tax=Hemibagrus wyckioides TaxID=337641 RepID=UPI00266CCB36|nr:tRNA methyltransferase 10 homolog C [Hemibagrus wyckioides]
MMFVRVHSVAVLRRFLPPASTLVKYHVTNPSTSCSAVCTSRCLSTGWTLKKEAPQHKPELDLDAWKSVMRSQASQKEKAKHREEETSTAEEEEEDNSPIEASRMLVDMWRQAGKKVPENITDEHLETLAELTTKSSKRKFLKYLAIKEGHKKANKEKKEKKKAERLTEVNKEEAGRTDGLEDAEEEGEGEPKLRNTYLMQFWTRSIDKALGWRAAQAMQFGQPLVYDMSYDQHMTRRELENTISQLMESEGWNRRSVDPFHLHFCNLQPGGAYKHELLKRYGQETWDRLFITATSQRHVDMFPREDLVYLTADSPNVLRTFDHSKVYIIGAMVDRSIQSGVSLANAKRLNLSTARLPLDEFLHWEIGAKNLTLDQMIRIMLTAKETGSWEKALEFVPKRKHDGFHQQRTKDSVQRSEKASTTVSAFRGNAEKIFVSKQRQKNLNTRVVQSKPTFRSENESSMSKLRIALRNKLEERGRVEHKRNWWEEE